MAYKFTAKELSQIKKLAKAINVDWKTLAARPESTKKMLLEFNTNGTVNGEKVTASHGYVWTVKNKKQEQIQGEDPVQTLVEFGKKHGTRGEIRVNRWQRTGGDMLTSTGVFFKGTFKEVVEKLKHHVTQATAGAAFKPDWTINETRLLAVLRRPGNRDGVELEALRQELAGGAYLQFKNIPKPVDNAIKCLIKCGFATKKKTNGKFLVKITDEAKKQVTVASDDVEFDEVNAEPDSKDTAEHTGVDFVGNAVIGDLKRIKSLIATWSKKTGKGSMDKEQLKAYVAYQKDVAGYIAKTYLPKLNKSYQAKVKAI